MKLTRLKKLRGYRVFQDFTWPNDLHDFARFNLIYGWNGSGKTTISTILRHVQTRTPMADGEIDLQVDDRSIRAADLASAAVPEIRVFNRDVALRSVFESAAEMEPIYFLGLDSVDKQRQIEKLKERVQRSDAEFIDAQTAVEKSKKAVDEFCIQRARLIKEALLTSRAAGYANYDKKRFRLAVDKMTDASAAEASLSEPDRLRLRQQKDSQPKDSIEQLASALLDFSAVTSSADALLRRSVTSRVLEDLARDPELAAWVQRGVGLHTGPRETKACRFCGQRIPGSRISELEAHFSDALSQFQAELGKLAARLEADAVRLERVAFPAPSALYEHLAEPFQEAVQRAEGALVDARAFLESVRAALLKKKEAPFDPIVLDSSHPAHAFDGAVLAKAFAAVNEVIRKHNATTADFQSAVDEACTKLELAHVAEAYPEYRRLIESTVADQERRDELESAVGALRGEIKQLEREIVEHRRPAEELNADLAAYLGRDELRIEVKDTGYRILRGGQPATHLSEGEKTAIAFLYFLKSLRDRSFDLQNGIVVVDDPVSSLDANGLYSAFGYMKERTKDAGQLFILTHNFSLFRQVRHWFRHLPHQNKKDVALRPARFFMLSAGNQDGVRTARLGPLDSLLEQHESEYHFLFKRVHDEAHRDAAASTLERQYEMPNVARRLLEAFLSFRCPDISGDLHAKLEQLEFEAARKARILRFLHTYSHHDSIAHPAHDLSILSETRAVLGDVLAMMRDADRAHFDRMLEATGVCTAPA